MAKPDNPYGCYNRIFPRRTLMVQDGWIKTRRVGGVDSRMPKMIVIANSNSRDCRYTLDYQDARCAGCKHENTKWGTRE